MKKNLSWSVVVTSIGLLILWSSVYGEQYELSQTDVTEPQSISSVDVSLFGVKLGDPENKAVETLVNEQISGIRGGTGSHVHLSSRPTETNRADGGSPNPGRQS